MSACAFAFFAHSRIVARIGAACRSSDHGIHGSSGGRDANFNKYPRYRGNTHTMLLGHDSRPCRMIPVPGNWIVYNCIGLAPRISNVGWSLCKIGIGIGKKAITFNKRTESIVSSFLHYRLHYLRATKWIKNMTNWLKKLLKNFV